MTIADLLGSPLPADIVQARSLDQIGIGWRKWLGMRVKIIDEYNRIPTRTQSALLTLMADNYAELYDQTFECPDAGGGTYQVIEALRDRIDIVVKALHFNSRCLGDLVGRLEAGIHPEEVVPGQIIFTEEDGDRLKTEIRRVAVPAPVLRRIEFFASQFEYFDPAAAQIEYKTKDTVKLSGIDWAQANTLDTGKDRVKDVGAQTRNGMSVRSLMTPHVREGNGVFRAQGGHLKTSGRSSRLSSMINSPRIRIAHSLRFPRTPHFVPTRSAGSAGCSTCPAE